MVRELETYLAPIANRLEASGHVSGAETVRDAMAMFRLHPDIPLELPGDKIYHHPLFDYDPSSGCLMNNGNLATLTTHENKLLNIYTANPNTVIKHEAIRRELLGYMDNGGSEDYKSHISSIGRKLKEIGVNPKGVIRSVPRKGYLLEDRSLVKDIKPGPPEELNPIVYNHEEFNFYPKSSLLLFPDGTEERLTLLETELLEMLMRNPNHPVSYYQLSQETKTPYGEVAPDLLKTHFSHIRKKLRNKNLIQARNRIGYMFVKNPEVKSEMPRKRLQLSQGD